MPSLLHNQGLFSSSDAHWPVPSFGSLLLQARSSKKKGYSFISNSQRRGMKARYVRRGEVGFEPRTFG